MGRFASACVARSVWVCDANRVNWFSPPFPLREGGPGGIGLLEAEMGRKILYIIGIIVALVAVGAGSFYGGTVYAAQQATNTRASFFAGRGGAGGAGGAGGNGGGGGGVAGTI